MVLHSEEEQKGFVAVLALLAKVIRHPVFSLHELGENLLFIHLHQRDYITIHLFL